jgi:TRAP-type C4-dicarboxylate transport system permease small subunit
MAATFFLMCMTAIHVILRKFTNFSIPGSLELTEISLVVIVFCAIAYLQSQNGHVNVDMFINFLPKRIRSVLSFVILLLSSAMLFVMFYAALIQIPEQMSAGLGTTVLHIPIWPFVAVMCIGILLYAVSLLIHAFMELIVGLKKGGEPAEREALSE